MNVPESALRLSLLLALSMLALCRGDVLFAAEAEDTKPITVSLADGAITMSAPGDWQRKKPRNNIIDHEFALPAVEGDAAHGRLTIMQAGGSVEDNISRWIGQFKQPDGKSTRDRAVIEEVKLGGQKAHTVDISGTFSDRRGPFAPAVERENYRMLAAIVVTEDHGQQFIKLYGPRKTIAAHEKAFANFLKSLKVKE